MGAYNYDKDDLNNAILCVWKEARGDGARGDECGCPCDL
jgi:hypothetical protein